MVSAFGLRVDKVLEIPLQVKIFVQLIGIVEVWCCRGVEKSWDHHLRNQEALHKVNVKGNIVHTITRRKANWIGHIWHGNCLLKHVIEGKVEGRREVKARRGRKREQPPYELKDTRRSWQLKGEALDR